MQVASGWILTWIIKQCCQTGSVRKSNGRQVIVPWLRQWRCWWLEGLPLRGWSEVSEFPLAVQTPLHTVTKCTGLNTFSARFQSNANNINILEQQNNKTWSVKWNNKTYTCVLEVAAVAPDTSSVAEGDLDSSQETSGFAGALSSASRVVKCIINSKQHFLRLNYILIVFIFPERIGRIFKITNLLVQSHSPRSLISAHPSPLLILTSLTEIYNLNLK